MNDTAFRIAIIGSGPGGLSAAEQGVMAIGALTPAWNDVAPFDRKTALLIGEMMNTLYDSVANDESFRPREFEAALRKIRAGLLN